MYRDIIVKVSTQISLRNSVAVSFARYECIICSFTHGHTHTADATPPASGSVYNTLTTGNICAYVQNCRKTVWQVCIFSTQLSGGWRHSAVVERRTCDQRGRGFESQPGTRRKKLGKVSHTYVPLSPSSISWYWPKGGDARRLGR